MTPPIKPSFALRALTNNADARFAGTVSSGDTTIALQTGHGAKLPQPRSGTATSTGNAQTLNDTGDLGVFAVGDFIENVTDGSIAIVLDVSGAPNSIKTTPLYGGSDNTWTSGDTWAKDRAILTFATLTDGVITTSERVKLTGRSTDSITVERGWDGDTPSGFSTGDYAYLLVEKSIMLEMQKAIKHMYMRIHESYLNTDRYAEASGTTGNAFSITLNPAITSLTDIIGMPINIKSDVTISGASTLSVNGLTAKNIKKNNGTTALGANNIESGQIFQVIYDGTNFQMQTFVPNTETLVTPEEIGFGDGSDGALNVTSGTTTIDLGGANVVVKNYTSMNVSSGATLTFSNPNSSGTIIVFRVIGNVTIQGTIDARGMGAVGGSGVTESGGTHFTQGNNGTTAYNMFGVTGYGQGGMVARVSTNTVASGAGSGASEINNGTTGASATQGSASASGGVGGSTKSSGIRNVIALGISFAPGSGGGSGGVYTTVASGTTPTGTSGDGGRGSGTMMIVCGGDYDDSGGVLHFSGSDAGVASKTNGTTQYSVVVGGSSGGGGGVYAAYVRGAIIMTGTKNINGGSGFGGLSSGAGGESVAHGSGVAGANGFAGVFQLI